MARLFLVTLVLVVLVARSVKSAPQESDVVDSKIYFGNESGLYNSAIHFGELTATIPRSVRTTEMPACVKKGSTKEDPCTADEDYDESIRAHVTQLIQRNNGLKALVADPILSNILNDTLLSTIKPSTRFGTTDVTQESPVCLSQETIIYPKRAKTPKDDWVFVVNQDNVQQAIRVEKCISEGHDCNFGMPLQGSATARCRQKYVYKRMLTVGSNIIEPEEVLMPSCCVCYTTNPDFDINSRVRNFTEKPTMTSPVHEAPARMLRFQ